MKKNLNILSLGMGRQSVGMLLMALNGHIDFRPDYSPFCDLGTEPKYVYDNLRLLKTHCAINHRFNIDVINKDLEGDIYGYLGDKIDWVSQIPLFVKLPSGKVSKLPRQCTRNYKIFEVKRFWNLYRDGKQVNCAMGFPKDEMDRAADFIHNQSKETKSDGSFQSTIFGSLIENKDKKSNKPNYLTYCFPLIDAGITTQECIDYTYEILGIKIEKSSCKWCPFHSNSFWYEMKINRPGEFAECVKFDIDIRNWPKIKNPVYLHRSCIPLGEIDFVALLGSPDFYKPSGTCHSGMCGV